MIRFATKDDLWEAYDRYGHTVPDDRPVDLKTFEDLICLTWLAERKGDEIGEIGGGYSRVLPMLAKRNSCKNIEDFSGEGHGPTIERYGPGVRGIRVRLGDFSPELPDESFDVLFSISVVEHLPDNLLTNFFLDARRVLKAGGLLLNFIDVYLSDDPGANEEASRRINLYRECVSTSFVPLGETDLPKPLRFRTNLVSNTDSGVYCWNKVGKPESIATRTAKQCCALIMAHRRI